MGAVNTTYTFTATDTITSTKMNDIIDQTTFTDDAVFDTTLAVASGKLKVNAQGITSNELAANSVTTVKITDSNVTTVKIADANITQVKLATNTVGNGPCFRMASRLNSQATAVNADTPTKIVLVTIDFDTNNNVSNSRFTPTIAGYYLINGIINGATRSLYALNSYIYKNGAFDYNGAVSDSLSYASTTAGIVYLNGSGDYVELYGKQGTPGAQGIVGELSGCLIRSA